MPFGTLSVRGVDFYSSITGDHLIVVQFWGIGRCAREQRGREVRRRAARLIRVAVVVVAAFLLLQASSAGPTREVRRVLIINVFDPLSSPGVAALDQGITASLESSPYQIELYSEDLEMTLFPDEAHQQQFREWYARKYHDRKPDVIIAVGLEPIRFMALSHKVSFPDTPIVFCGSTEEMLGQLKLDSDFTGVWEVAQPEKTLIAALHLQPGTKHVIVVGGVGAYDRYLEAIARESFRKYQSRFDFSYLTDLAMPALLERLKHLSDDTIVYHTSLMQDASGTRFIDATQSVPLIASASKAPVFVVDDVDLGRGTVGGDVLSWASDGRVVGEIAVRVLNGERPQDIPIVRGANLYAFDWRALKRWGLQESALPPGSIVLNRQPTVWESYKWYIIGGISVILAEALLIFGLVWQRARAREAETELALTYDRLRLAVEAGRSVGWDWDLKSGQDRWFGDLETVFGIPSESYSGHVDDFRRKVHPEDRELVWQAVAEARQNRKPYIAEFRVVRKDGAVRWITARGKFYYAGNGDAERMLGMAVDITDRKQAEHKLRESQNRLAGIVGSAMDAIIAVDEEQRIVLFNAAAEKMFGCTRDDAVGTAIDRFIPERLRAEYAAQVRRFGESGVTTRGMGKPTTLMAVRTNGQEFPMEASITHLESDGGKLFAVTLRDITERKLAEEAMADIGRKLIEAHEEERTRIGRELHDDINQRLALAVIELEQWGQEYSRSEIDIHKHIAHIKQRLSDLGKDVQALSHRLHSSKLDYLGLTVAASSFCRELSEKQNVEIDFTHEGMPGTVPKEISLCLFRILQEALQNAVKYSGVRHFTVRLEGTPAEIELSVTDHGAGFDQQSALSGRGLGLISMRERIQLVKGELSITSQLAGGTTVCARVPFHAEERRTRLAG
jgi:PAS domain S-box-containing protein